MKCWNMAIVVVGVGLWGAAPALTQDAPRVAFGHHQKAACPAPPEANPAEASQAEQGKVESKPDVEFALAGDKRECIQHGKIHDGLDDPAKTDFKTKDNTLTMLISGVAAAHCFLGTHSASVHLVQVCQEFDVKPADERVTQVVVVLESTLKGYVRSRHNGAACLRLASATISPVHGGGPPLCVSYAAACASGPGCAYEVKQERKLPEQTLPVGRYLLTANFQIDAEADGFLNGHGVANFSPDALADAWKQENDPFKDTDPKDFGFNLTLTATLPSAEPKAQSARTPNVNRVHFVAPARPAAP